MASAAPGARAQAAPSLDTSDYLETRSVQLEWKVSNLKNLFDATQGPAKSKCIKIFLYPNSGHDQYISLYLSCEPTAAEKERALAEQPTAGPSTGGGGPGAATGGSGGKEKDRILWRRDGKFLFTFEVRSVDRRITFKQLESEKPHVFWAKERNWGYASFWRRNEAFYNNPNTRAADAFLIICTIVSSPTLPTTPPPPHLLVPKTLIRSYASLFDDPDYSDVVFRIRPEGQRGRNGGKVREKRLFAAKKVLAGRSEYFNDMFSSAFSEATLTRPPASSRRAITTTTTTSANALSARSDDGDMSSEGEDEGSSDVGWDEDDDSGLGDSEVDDEDGSEDGYGHDGSHDADSSNAYTAAPTSSALSTAPVPANDSSFAPFPSLSTSHSPDAPHRRSATGSRRSRTSSAALSDDEDRPAHAALSPMTSGRDRSSEGVEQEGDEEDAEDEETESDGIEQEVEVSDPGRPATPRRSGGGGALHGERSRFVDAPSAPASPIRAPTVGGEAQRRHEPGKGVKAGRKEGRRKVDERPRFEVVVTDASYTTFRALLHYLYTDSITFAPLASNYHVAKETASQSGQPFPYASRHAYLAAQLPPPTATAGDPAAAVHSAVSPCSAKAIYRLSDKMDLAELKERAYEHIVSSLTAQNIVYEVFGSFSSRFDEIRRVEVAFLLDKWNEVRSSVQMRKVFDYLRNDLGRPTGSGTSRFPGFEDVWLEIVQNLEVRVVPPSVAPAPVSVSAGGGSSVGERGTEEDAR
ncbi:hypothetical protein Rhopal_000684-T1 [Rhodotorula paludigena]|uniref:BTB domain-containing protein n=1 Tax=Rhodotorula paludigena TaxID=86838 RepID=A0AAV5GBC3_9BASI|nr:hypothetical protein Rhopal_000684-T1 [Rhodotorula paludigena]